MECILERNFVNDESKDCYLNKTVKQLMLEDNVGNNVLVKDRYLYMYRQLVSDIEIESSMHVVIPGEVLKTTAPLTAICMYIHNNIENKKLFDFSIKEDYMLDLASKAFNVDKSTLKSYGAFFVDVIGNSPEVKMFDTSINGRLCFPITRGDKTIGIVAYDKFDSTRFLVLGDVKRRTIRAIKSMFGEDEVI